MHEQDDIVWAAWCLVSSLSETEKKVGDQPWHSDLIYLRRLLESKGLAVVTDIPHTHELSVS